MQESLPRYEFRAFAQNFGQVEDNMRRLYKIDNFREGLEIYHISAGISANVKIRYGLLDIKTLLKEEKGLQQWVPLTREKFPLDVEFIRNEVLPCLGIKNPEFG